MSRSWFRSLVPIVMAMTALVPVSMAGTTGKLTGKIINEKKEPMAGVNIRIEGQRLGAISDDQGSYVIIGVPAGTYGVHANLMGSTPYLAENVTITPDFTTELNIVMKTEAVQMEEVKVEAQRPLLQKDATSTTRFLSADQIARLPTRGYRDAAAQQSGVVNFARQIDTEAQNGNTLIIRGGRPNETAYFVDGFSQQDPLTGNATTNINNNAIQEVVLLNGGFNAEYGRIMSGVVNVITREGGGRYSGNLEAVSDNMTGVGNDFLGAKVYDYNVYDGSFGGPLVRGKDWGSFYYSGQRRWQLDRAPLANFDGPLPSNSLGGWTHQGKITLPLTNHMQLRLGGLYSRDDWHQYLNAFRYDLLHAPRYQDLNQSLTGQFSHTLSARSFYSLGVNWFYTRRQLGDGKYFDNVNLYGSTADPAFRDGVPWFYPGISGTPGDPLSDSLAATALKSGSDGKLYDYYLKRESQYIGFKGDYTNQVSAFHQLKGGFEYDRHTLRYYENLDPKKFSSGVYNDINRYGFSLDGRSHEDNGLDGPRKPVTASGYLQDKFERAGLVVNVGLRYDYINTDTKALSSENLPLGTNGVLDSTDLEPNRIYQRLSPRLGIGFPVTDRMVLHVNYGQFFQQPNLQDLYVSYRYLEYKIQIGGYFYGFGNPNLKPEQTTAYEVGIAQQVSDYAKLDITAYYKDVKDLVQIATIPSQPNNFASYRNKDFATIKGLDFGFTLRRVNHIQAAMAYSLSYALGTGSVSNTQRIIAWTAADPPKQTAPLDFDQRHKVSLNLDYALGRGEGPKLAAHSPLQNFDVSVLYNVASGTPFTPNVIYDEVSQLATFPQPIGPINSRYGPWTQNLDFKVTKGWGMGNLNMSAYVWVLNALDTKNAIYVYTGTGSPFTTAYLSTDAGQNDAAKLAGQGIDPKQTYDTALQSQSHFSNPRMVRVGLRMGF
ncbi:MAG: TonB-dependent receptor [Candidatus Eisenbacteria bacterium]|nr:TonB-dependent receptor [Candidatus Eisenbacteria bacterium]